jgi:hypothetical protein
LNPDMLRWQSTPAWNAPPPSYISAPEPEVMPPDKLPSEGTQPLYRGLPAPPVEVWQFGLVSYSGTGGASAASTYVNVGGEIWSVPATGGTEFYTNSGTLVRTTDGVVTTYIPVSYAASIAGSYNPVSALPMFMGNYDREYGAIQQAGLNPGYMFRGAGALDDNWAPQPIKLTTAGNVPSPIIPHYGSGGM